MSFNAKNLSYEVNQPAFLQRLRGQFGDSSGRLERPITTRPRKPKDANDDDDEPTYVFEDSNEVISKEEYEALVRGDNKEDEKPGKGSEGQDEQTSQVDEDGKPKTEKDAHISKQNLAEIGGPKKRKQAKVIGDESAGPDSEQQQEEASSQKPKQKQKKKKIKLSFDE